MKSFLLTVDSVGKNLQMRWVQTGEEDPKGMIHGKTNLIAQLPLNSNKLVRDKNTLAYYPSYKDTHVSGLAAVFVNIEQLFPCVTNTWDATPKYNYRPACTHITSDEDGFRHGKPIIELGDVGNDAQLLNIFTPANDRKKVSVYGIAVQGCKAFGEENGCLPPYFTTKVICFLPRTYCDPYFSQVKA